MQVVSTATQTKKVKLWKILTATRRLISQQRKSEDSKTDNDKQNDELATLKLWNQKYVKTSIVSLKEM